MKVQLTIPNNLNEVTLGQYQEYLKLENLTQTELSFKMIEIFCKLDTKAVRSLKATDIKEIAQIITDMFESKPSLVHSFKLGGTEYGFINNLDEMTFGEYIDLDTYIGDWENIEKAMGVLYRPVKHRKGGRYVIEDYEAKDAEPLKDMPLDAVLGSIIFFYHLGNDLCQVMMNSFQEETETNSQELHNLGLSTDGIQAFMLSLSQILGDLKISLN